ncbi:hypothetical protein Dvina_28255 [Dactylosporangium vinaceum]|uniref:Uncharacterized protein n=1 Tax=Dactylosporangium vinaceum TaxID=53362 RepID=A0ABV5MMP1_9ACTN|nr:hypothetical protein [Dactylosporangium vinaceum]UAB92266.1 hypothetical protein Dvina_28255 [Dactylosporangium vinaceum]
MAFQRRWGGLALPPAPAYDGGPRLFAADTPEPAGAGAWMFETGPQRTAVPYSFVIGPDDAFGLAAGAVVALHDSIEGWIESVALAHEVAGRARQITTLTGPEADAVALAGLTPIPEVRGRADTWWWRDPDTLVAAYGGEAAALDFPAGRTVRVYSLR